MSLSPDGTLLAAIHFSGKLSIWAVPSLMQQGEWNQNEQVRLSALILECSRLRVSTGDADFILLIFYCSALHSLFSSFQTLVKLHYK